MEIPVKMDDLGVPLFSETLIYRDLKKALERIPIKSLLSNQVSIESSTCFSWLIWFLKGCCLEPSEVATKPTPEMNKKEDYPIGYMGLVYLPTWMVDVHGKLVA